MSAGKRPNSFNHHLHRLPVVPAPAMIGSYIQEDVVFLLKDLGDYLQEQGNVEREEAIQSGRHYSEMLPIEYYPTSEYIDLFYESLGANAYRIALAIGIVSRQIIRLRGRKLALVSLARAGTPIGILIKRYIQHFYSADIPHYSISIIRDRGLDENAISYILRQHQDCSLQFIDGWTGKGVITKELITSLEKFEQKYAVPLDHSIAVLADPGYCAHIFGTRDDFLIPSACLNSTVCGLVSRTVYRKDLIGEMDFHGAKYYPELADKDLSYVFIDQITDYFDVVDQEVTRIINNNPSIGLDSSPAWSGFKEISGIKRKFNIEHINFIKPGVGETTRVLLRRVPWKVLIKNPDHPDLRHILLLAKERGVPVEEYPDMAYSCCGLINSIKNLEKG